MIDTITKFLVALLALFPTVAWGQTFSGGYRTVDKIYADLATTAAVNPTLIDLIDYGDSYAKTVGGITTPGGDFLAGYDLLAVRVTNKLIPGPKPPLFMIAELHARELPPTEIAMRYLDMLVSGYGTDAQMTWLVNERDIWIVPVVNPDGRWLVELGTKPPYNGSHFQWRKNGRPGGSCAWPPTFESHFGVDLNRNFLYGWGGPGSVTTLCGWAYRGAAAGSEPEVQALMNLVASVIPDQRGPGEDDPAPPDTTGVFLSLHTNLHHVYYSRGHPLDPGPNYTDITAIGAVLSWFTGYPYGPDDPNTPPSPGPGGMEIGWVYDVFGVPSILLEMDAHAPSMTGLNNQWNKVKWGLVYLAKIASQPYILVHGPRPLNVAGTVNGSILNVSATIDDTNNGGLSISAAAAFIDVTPCRGGTPIPLVASDGNFDEVIEGVIGSIDISGLASGQHTLYVNGTDAAGNVGILNPVFFVKQ